MEYLILGLLMMNMSSGYEMRSFIRSQLGLIASDSAGSFQTALKKLLKNGYVAELSRSEGRGRVDYCITASGREYFHSWVTSPIDSGRRRSMELGKLFFLGYGEGSERRKSIQLYLDSLDKTAGQLALIEKSLSRLEQEDDEILYFEKKLLEYGLESQRMEKKFFSSLLKDMEEKGY